MKTLEFETAYDRSIFCVEVFTSQDLIFQQSYGI